MRHGFFIAAMVAVGVMAISSPCKAQTAGNRTDSPTVPQDVKEVIGTPKNYEPTGTSYGTPAQPRTQSVDPGSPDYVPQDARIEPARSPVSPTGSGPNEPPMGGRQEKKKFPWLWILGILAVGIGIHQSQN